MNINFTEYNEVLKRYLAIDSETADILEDELKHQIVFGGGAITKFTSAFYLLLVFLSKLPFILGGFKKRVLSIDDDFVFVSCPDPVFRTKNINLLAAGLKYSIIYIPNLHVRSSLKYMRYFRQRNVNTIFPMFLLSDYHKAQINASLILKNLHIQGKKDYRLINYQVLTYSMYKCMVERNFSSYLNTFGGKWVFEHQKFYFIPFISSLKESSKHSYLLQHGCFFKPSRDFFPLYCDTVFCCSKREKEHYIDAGVSDNRVVVLGAPLQMLSDSNVNHYCYQHVTYELLLLLTSVVECKDIQPAILNYIHQRYPNLTVLLRFRPRSKQEDKTALYDVLYDYDISEEMSLECDIERAKKVISFSEDATYEVLKWRKPFIIASSDTYVDEKIKQRCATMSNFKQYVDNLINNDSYSSLSPEEIEYYMGDMNISSISMVFKRSILS